MSRASTTHDPEFALCVVHFVGQLKKSLGGHSAASLQEALSQRFLSQVPEFSAENKHLMKTGWENCMNLLGESMRK